MAEGCYLMRRLGCCAGARTFEEQLAFAAVTRELCGALEIPTSLVEAAEPDEEVAAYAGQEVVTLERASPGQAIDEIQT